jgi:hypothetical protein
MVALQAQVPQEPQTRVEAVVEVGGAQVHQVVQAS